MFAAHHRLSNLVAIVDLNGQQALGYTRDVLDLVAAGRALARVRLGRPRGGRSRPGRARDAIAGSTSSAGPPHVLVAHTIFGKGVSFMEQQHRVALPGR